MDHNKSSHHNHHQHMIDDFKKRLKATVPLTVLILLLSPLIQRFLGISDFINIPYEQYILFVLSSIVFFYGGYPFFVGLRDELKSKNPGMMTLIGIAVSVAYFYSSAVVVGLITGELFFWELATLVDVMLLGHWMEMRSVIGASRALEELARLMPKTAHKIIKGEQTEDVAIDKLVVGDKVLVKPGEKIPVDGKIIKGSSSVNESLLTGESKLVEKQTDNKVIAGAVNGDGALVIKIEKLGKDSYLAGVVNLVRSAQEAKSKTQNLTNRAARWLTIAAISVGLITFVAWLTLSSQDLGFAIERTVAVMVIACPHALGVAIPLVVAISTAQTAQRGLLIRNRTAFEDARNINAIIFDKTGTLTKGKFGVSNIIVLNKKYSKEKIQQLAASLEAKSQHPIAQAIARTDKNHHKVEKFKSLTGQGVEGIVEGKKIKVVSPGFLKQNKTTIENKDVKKAQKEGKTVVFVLENNKPIGSIALEDVVRKESKNAISSLKKQGIKTMMLTGDSEDVAATVAKKLDIDEYFAQVLPDKKSKKVQEIQRQGYIVAMVGDGVNDAPALAQADVGIAIGSGTDVAAETADIILVSNNPQDAVRVISFAKKTYRKMQENLVWATGYNVIAVPLAAGVLYSFGIILNPAVGAFFMSLSTVIVALNAKTLKLT